MMLLSRLAAWALFGYVFGMTLVYVGGVVGAVVYLLLCVLLYVGWFGV